MKKEKSVVYELFDTPVLKSISQVTDGIKIKWESVEGVKKYRVARRVDDGKWKILDITDETQYVDKDVESGKKYTYTVRCMNDDATVVQSSYDKKGLSFEYVLLDIPVISNLENVEGGVKVTWESVPEAAKYRVYHKVGDGKWEKLIDTDLTECIDESVENGITYSYSVRCLSENGKVLTSAIDKKGVSITYIK